MPTTVLLTTAVILGCCAAVLLLMLSGWRHRMRKQRDIAEPPQLPAGLGEPLYALDDVHYVATSETGRALERIVVPPLAYRGRATVEVHPGGVAVGISAARPFFIPVDRIETIARAQATIDRAVERDGLLVIRWRIDTDHSVETYFRVVHPGERQALLDALTSLIAHTHTQEHA
ncbi:PH-like domain-containing protein [Gulosibacter hominis]|uniref:PH-like domain-containing protein n=1 Tax=Gulosibacter hominis TaxID=2770504 RepID=UPI001919BEF6|nr:hypothetical protein [Gulosibacter hominis]